MNFGFAIPDWNLKRVHIWSSSVPKLIQVKSGALRDANILKICYRKYRFYSTCHFRTPGLSRTLHLQLHEQGLSYFRLHTLHPA